jgi:putative membrane protein
MRSLLIAVGAASLALSGCAAGMGGAAVIDHHTQTTAQLTAAARAAGMTPPPPALMPPQQQMMAQLQQAQGTSFDQVYLRQQVPAHQMALALHQNYAARGDTPQLRTVAAAAVPIVQGHLAQAQQMNR